MLANKSLTELRGIAQSFNIPDIFQKDKLQLAQAIELKQQSLIPEPKVVIPRPPYDARLMTKPPSKKSDKEEAETLLAPYIARGLRVTFEETEERWYMAFDKKTDEGTMRMPLKILLKCADRIME